MGPCTRGRSSSAPTALTVPCGHTWPLWTASRTRRSNNEEPPYLTTYRCFWMRFPRLPGIAPGDMTESHGPRATTQYFPPARTRPSLPSMSACRSRRAGHPDATPARTSLPSSLGGATCRWTTSPLPERQGRDAAHKFTPSTGAGCNNGIVDVVVLVNKLHKIFATADAGGSSSSVTNNANIIPEDELAAAFREYQEARFDTVTLGCGLSGRATSNASWATPWAKFMDLYVLSVDLVPRLFLRWAAGKTALSPVFDFIESEDAVVGKYPWVHKCPCRRRKKPSYQNVETFSME
ncbi:hypothetical protein PG987_001841 [Apiospora arundinis]